MATAPLNSATQRILQKLPIATDNSIIRTLFRKQGQFTDISGKTCNGLQVPYPNRSQGRPAEVNNAQDYITHLKNTRFVSTIPYNICGITARILQDEAAKKALCATNGRLQDSTSTNPLIGDHLTLLRERFRPDKSYEFNKEDHPVTGWLSNFSEKDAHGFYINVENQRYYIDTNRASGDYSVVNQGGRKFIGLVIDGEAYPSGEHFFQYAKHLKKYNGVANTPNAKSKVKNAATSLDALTQGKQLALSQQAIKHWDTVGRCQAMMDLKRAQLKIMPMRQALLNIGERELIENTSTRAGRLYEPEWGTGAHGEGKNMLGKIWKLAQYEIKTGYEFDMTDHNVLAWLQKPWVDDLEQPIPDFSQFKQTKITAPAPGSSSTQPPLMTKTTPPTSAPIPTTPLPTSVQTSPVAKPPVLTIPSSPTTTKFSSPPPAEANSNAIIAGAAVVGFAGLITLWLIAKRKSLYALPPPPEKAAWLRNLLSAF